MSVDEGFVVNAGSIRFQRLGQERVASSTRTVHRDPEYLAPAAKCSQELLRKYPSFPSHKASVVLCKQDLLYSLDL